MQTILLVLSHILLSHTNDTTYATLDSPLHAVRGAELTGATLMTQPTVTRCAITLGHTNDTTYATLDCVREPRVSPSVPECVTCAVISLMNGLIHALNVSKHSLRQAREGGGGLRA